MPSWTSIWTRFFTKLYFPGNLVSKVRCGKSAPQVQVLSRDDASGQQSQSLGGIEYVDIDIPNSQSALLVSHGQLRILDQGSVDQWMEWGRKYGISILLHNYPGYGKTPGPVTADRILADLEKLVEMLKKKWEEDQICLLGNSAGCGPTIALAAAEKYRFKRVVLISPYTSCFSWGLQFLSFLRNSRFDPFVSINLMPKLKDREVFMICGKGDKTIPASNSAELFESLGRHSENHEKNYLCTLPEEDHKYTRLKGMNAIAFFLNGQTSLLGEELQRLTEGNTEAPHNKYSD